MHTNRTKVSCSKKQAIYNEGMRLPFLLLSSKPCSTRCCSCLNNLSAESNTRVRWEVLEKRKEAPLQGTSFWNGLLQIASTYKNIRTNTSSKMTSTRKGEEWGERESLRTYRFLSSVQIKHWRVQQYRNNYRGLGDCARLGSQMDAILYSS